MHRSRYRHRQIEEARGVEGYDFLAGAHRRDPQLSFQPARSRRLNAFAAGNHFFVWYRLKYTRVGTSLMDLPSCEIVEFKS